MSNTIAFTAHHFASSLSADDARNLFRQSVCYVEIETFTYCNRKCWFCPNKDLPQRQDREGSQFMLEALYLRILDELSAVGYAGQIQFGRYNEPLADRVILTRIFQARERLPEAYLYSHTNGDYLTREYLDELKSAGLDELKIQTYLGNEEQWDEAKMLERQNKQLSRLGLLPSEILYVGRDLRHYYKTNYEGMYVSIDACRFSAFGTDRGGLLQIRQHRPRVAPCLIPFSHMYIDWNGSVMPCCNLRSDVPEHAPYIVANLNKCSLFDAYVKLNGWRKSLMRFDEKAAPCATCRYGETDVAPEAAAELERIHALACHG